ncbi:MAG TPA: polyamine ABC transporter substrate-binding protein [Xanthomonadales bacterium]|nr:polyamine ABC transporter substrate-binding protein [Xanthomonadales bacterium]
MLRRAHGILLAAALASAAAVAEEAVLNIYNWADYIAPGTIADFEEEFGIRVNYDTYDSTEIVEARLLAGKTGYDVVFHGYRYSARLIAVDVYQPLEMDRLPLRSNLDPWVMSVVAQYDPGNRFGVPFMWGTTGAAYNVDMVRQRLADAPIDGGRLLFDPQVVAQLADCGVSLLDEPTDVIPMVLQYLGHDPNSLEPAHIAAAERQLKAVRPYIRYFSSAKMINDLPNGEICVAMSWSGDYLAAANRAQEVGASVNLDYAVPNTGSMLWFDAMFIPVDAPHPGNAHRFINYLLRPEVIAAISNTTYYANANQASRPFVLPEITTNPLLYPRQQDAEKYDLGFIFGPKDERLRTRAWSRIKTGL